VEELLTLREAAKKLRVAEVTLYRLARQGKLPAIKVGGGWRFKPEVLEAWLAHGGARREARVLVVDDDPVLLDLVRGIVAGAGYTAIAAPDGERALELLKEEPADLVFLDVLLPATSSLEVFQKAKQLNPRVTVVLMTGYPDHPVVAEAMALGPLMLLRKPFGIPQVTEILGMVFRT
jgi:excisionase family DNA binding protein